MALQYFADKSNTSLCVADIMYLHLIYEQSMRKWITVLINQFI